MVGKPDWMDSWKRGEKSKAFNIAHSFEEHCCKGKEEMRMMWPQRIFFNLEKGEIRTCVFMEKI